jgi:Flp pilus assembly protein TadG
MIRHIRLSCTRLAQCETGAMAIEMAFITPLLITLGLGGFEISSIVARETELQSAMAEAAAIVRASPPETAEDRTTIRDILVASTGLSNSQVSVAQVYRCGTASSYVNRISRCNGNNDDDASDTADATTTSGDDIATFVSVTLVDTYVPVWTEYGVGNALTLNVNRTILIG